MKDPSPSKDPKKSYPTPSSKYASPVANPSASGATSNVSGSPAAAATERRARSRRGTMKPPRTYRGASDTVTRFVTVTGPTNASPVS